MRHGEPARGVRRLRAATGFDGMSTCGDGSLSPARSKIGVFLAAGAAVAGG